MELVLAGVPVAATVISWLLTTGKSSLDLWQQLEALKGEGPEGILAVLAADDRHRKNMLALYQWLEAARPKAEAVLRRRRRANLLTGAGLVLTVVAGWLVLSLLTSVLQATWPVIAVATVAGVAVAALPSRLMPLLPAGIDLDARLRSARDTVADVAGDVRSRFVQEALRLEKLAGSEVERDFLQQFLATQRLVERVEAVLLGNQLADSQRKLEDAYRDQIAGLLAGKLEDLLLRPEHESINQPSEFAEVAYAELDRLGYLDLLAFDQADIERLVTDEVIRGYRTNEPRYLVKLIKTWAPLRKVQAADTKAKGSYLKFWR